MTSLLEHRLVLVNGARLWYLSHRLWLRAFQSSDQLRSTGGFRQWDGWGWGWGWL
jgi:hypothetical protein